MSEGKKRREWVKNVAIIFLSVLLVLTFFSNTIMNYSLPEVAAQYCYSDSITNKVKGTATVSATDPYSVVFKQSRKIASVKVTPGDTVEKGDVLFVLEDEESTELKTALEALESLKDEYNRALVTKQISSSISSSVENGTTKSDAEKQKAIDSYKSKITSAEKKVTKYQSEINEIDKQIERYGSDEDLEERVALAKANEELATWRKQKVITESMLATSQATLDAADPSDPGYAALVAKRDEALTCDNTATTQIALCENKVSVCQETIDKKILELRKSRAASQKNLDAAEESLKKAESDLSKLSDKYLTEYELKDKLKEIEKQEKYVEELKGTEGGNEIVAPVSGNILSVAYSAGQTINAGDTVSTIQIAGKGYSMTMSVSREQASLISIGDEAEIINSWWYSDVHARVIAIRPDPVNPSQSKQVVFELEGDVSDGQSLSLTIGRKTANYDCVVPSSAVREDNNGKFVYRVTQKSTPLGIRYYAERVDVKVLAVDGTRTAISGDLENWEYIITTATKPLQDGTQIRLKD